MIRKYYCDESGHLEHDSVPVMVLGSLWCETNEGRNISKQIREIKKEHGLSKNFEIKWTKVSPGKEKFYLAILNYFLCNNDLHFRAVVIPDKSVLNHDVWNQDHNTWYYKMYYVLLHQLMIPEAEHYIYLDIKDTRGGDKINKLHEVLASASHDFEFQSIKPIQQVRSHEVEQIQLVDLLIGAVSYANRGLSTNYAKVAFIREFRERSGLSLTRTTSVESSKVNILIWEASKHV